MVERRQTPAARPLVLVEGIAEDVVVLVRLSRARGRVGAVLVDRTEASHVHLSDVVGRLPIDQPVRDDLADGAARAEAGVGEPARGPQARHAGHRAEERPAVGCDPLGAVDEVGHLGLREHRDPPDGAFQDRLEQLPVRGQELLSEVPGHAVDRPRDGLGLEATDEEAAHFLAHVNEVLRVAEAGRRAGQLVTGDGLGGEMLVDHRRDGKLDAGQGCHLAGPHARGVDHNLGAEAPVLGDHGRDGARRPALQGRDPPASLHGHPGLARPSR